MWVYMGGGMREGGATGRGGECVVRRVMDWTVSCVCQCLTMACIVRIVGYVYMHVLNEASSTNYIIVLRFCEGFWFAFKWMIYIGETLIAFSIVFSKVETIKYQPPLNIPLKHKLHINYQPILSAMIGLYGVMFWYTCIRVYCRAYVHVVSHEYRSVNTNTYSYTSDAVTHVYRF